MLTPFQEDPKPQKTGRRALTTLIIYNFDVVSEGPATYDVNSGHCGARLGRTATIRAYAARARVATTTANVARQRS